MSTYFDRLVRPLLAGVALLALSCTAENPDTFKGDDAGGTMGDMSMSGGADGGIDLAGSDPHAAIADQCAKLAAAVCDRLGSCSKYLLRYYYGDAATCTERVQLTCAPYVELQGSSWTLDRLRACTAGYASGTCDDYFAPGGPPACRPQAGSVADGATCANSNQCKSATCSLGLSGCGSCIQPAKTGEACTAQKPCALGLSCASGKCAPEGTAGSMCGNGLAPCQTGLYCKTNACTKVVGVGGTCDPASTAGDCDPIQGLYCDQLTRKCTAYSVVDSGQPCGQTAGGIAICAASGTCTGTTGNRKCAAAAMDTAACGAATSTNLSCISPATCNAGACRVFDPATCK